MSERPQDLPAPDMRERILAASTRLFARRGYEGTSLQVIADAVGVRKPSLLYHFSSKGELRQGVLDALLDRWKDILPQVMLAATSGEDRFERATSEVVAFFRPDPARARLLLRELLDRPDETRALLHERLLPWMDGVAAYIRAGQREGLIHDDVDPAAYITGVILLILGAFACADVHSAFLTEADVEPIDRQIREVLRMAGASLFR